MQQICTIFYILVLSIDHLNLLQCHTRIPSNYVEAKTQKDKCNVNQLGLTSLCMSNSFKILYNLDMSVVLVELCDLSV